MMHGEPGPGDAAASGVLRWAYEPKPGELIDGRYLVEAPIGRGGMGVVVRAHDVDLDRRVAIKIIRRDAPDADAIERFVRHEARALAELRSAHVVTIHAFGRHRGWFYFVMDLVNGRSLADEIDEASAAGRTLPLRAALQILEGIAAGLDDVHAAGLLHRDVKPDNVVVEAGTRRPILIDFGLVSHRSAPGQEVGTGASTGDGRESALGGTPGYMAPEQCLGGEAVSTAVDVYGFACTAFEVLTGRPVFAGASPGELIARHALATPPLASSIRPELAPVDAVLAAALAKDPAARPASCGALARVLVDGLCVAAVVERSFRVSDHAAPVNAAACDRRPAGFRLLVVEGDPREARIVSRAAAFVFHGLHLRVALCDEPRKALALSADAAPDLLVVDLGAGPQPVLDVLMALKVLHPRARLRVAVRTDAPLGFVAERLADFGPVDVVPRSGGLAAALAALEELAQREGLLEHRSDAGGSTRAFGRQRLLG